ncbi:MAG: terpene cyclase/mutase family protein [Planctomycetes bacterium]|nr:terpene cyclase/mutase family protein [Planctomycetota bacterium]
MLQVARLAPKLLSAAAERVVEYLHGQWSEEGGVKDRAGESDLYYTVFGIEGLVAFQHEPPFAKLRPYLDGFGDGEGLDLVHLACLARCRAALPRAGGGGAGGAETARRLAERIERCRAADGGYAPAPGARHGTAYHGFLALGALQDLGVGPAEPVALAGSLAALQLEDGSFANRPGIRVGTTPTTAGAVTALRNLGAPVPPRAGDWLLARARPEGGFAAAKETPIPDLLSTATALHSLAGLHVPVGHLREAALDFVDTLWTGRGFCGTWADEEPDCEYTYYGLLALGHLSLV